MPVRWHLIGHLQGNKARKTLPLVLDGPRGRLPEAPPGARRPLGRPARPAGGLPPGEHLRRGVEARLVAGRPAHDAEAIAACRRVPVVGLMTIAGYGTTPETARPSFAALRGLRDDLGGAPASPSHTSRWGCRTTSRRRSRKGRRSSGSARPCSRGSTRDRLEPHARGRRPGRPRPARGEEERGPRRARVPSGSPSRPRPRRGRRTRRSSGCWPAPSAARRRRWRSCRARPRARRRSSSPGSKRTNSASGSTPSPAFRRVPRKKETGDRRQETGGRDQKSDPPSFSAVKVPPDEGV